MGLLAQFSKHTVTFIITILLFVGMACELLYSGPMDGDSNGNQSLSHVANAEIQKQQAMQQHAKKLLDAGSAAQADGRFGEAMDNYADSFVTLPNSPIYANLRQLTFRRYQSATIQYTQQMINQARWDSAKGAINDAIKLGKDSGLSSSMDATLRKMLTNLNDPEYYTTAISPKHLENVEKVKRLLLLGQGAMDYGRYDQAVKAYNQVLNIDRYNTAARRGMEKVERLKMNYYDGARGHSRSRFLREVNEAWEMPVPVQQNPDAFKFENLEKGAMGRRQELQEKLDNLIVPVFDIDQATLDEALEVLVARSKSLDVTETDPNLRGISFLIDRSTFADGNPGDRPVTLRNLQGLPIGAILRYICSQTQSTFRVEEFTIKIISTEAGRQEVLQTLQWIVPPSFLSQAGPAANNQALDPFAPPPAASGPTRVTRITPQDFLTSQGISFGEGAVATYNATSSLLTVRNTPSQLELIEELVRRAREGSGKMIELRVKIISIDQETLKSKGVDHLLGQANIGASDGDSIPRTFFGGGTNGNQTPGLDADSAPFLNPGGTLVGVNPITAGLRRGDFSAGDTIDELINNDLTIADNAADPATFAVAGVFTDPQFQSIFRLFTQDKGTDVMCDTGLLVKPGEPAKIEIIREFIYPTEYEAARGSQGLNSGGLGSPFIPATPTAFETRPLGKVLDLEATLGEDEKTIDVNVVLDFADLAGFINYGVPFSNSSITNFIGLFFPGQDFLLQQNDILMPVFDTVREQTSVTVWDGATIVIGGLYGHSVDDREDKIPYGGDLPVLGRLLRSEREQHNKQALLIFLTANLVDPGGEKLNSTLDDLQPNEVRPFRDQPTPTRPDWRNFNDPTGPFIQK